jgi:adenosylcobinamide-GDP ribazoletransferase
MMEEPTSKPPQGWRGLLADLALMVRFYSRLPVPALPFEGDPHRLPDFRTATRMLPLAGLLIGVPAACALWLSEAAGLPPLAVAGLAVAVNAVATGAFHEDGLADTFDGLAGGRTPERRLEIMKDSRVGAFGGTALALGLLLRVVLLAALVEEWGAPAAWLLLASATLTRTTSLLPLAALPPARPDGFTAAVGRPTLFTFGQAMLVALALSGVLLGLPGAAVGGGLAGTVLALAAAGALAAWARSAIRGQTGDIAGASQQAGEIGFLAGLVALG